MNIEQHICREEGGTIKGTSIHLTGDDVALAIESWLLAHDVHTRGPRTITVNRDLCECGNVYVDPSGFVVYDGKRLSGRGTVALGTIAAATEDNDGGRMILTIAEIKTLAQFAGLVLTDDSRTDTEQDETEIAVADCPEGGIIDTDAATVRYYAHVAYFYEYQEEGSVGLGDELPND